MTAIKITRKIPRNRLVYAAAAGGVIGMGLVWRSGYLPLSSFAAKYGGDALWALVVFLGFGFLFCRASTLRIALVSFCFAWAVEFLQLYHVSWIDSLRGSRAGHLILGSTFHGPDLLAYAIGVAVGALGEGIFIRLTRR
jgi:hypothetical protein